MEALRQAVVNTLERKLIYRGVAGLYDDGRGCCVSTSGLSIYKGFDLKNYSFLYSIPDENVQEIKIREREGLYKVSSS